MHRIGWTIACLALTACGPEPTVEQTAQQITNGTTHTGHPAVGKLIFALTGGTAQDGACTATLVGSKTVLAAAHCLGYKLTEWVDDTKTVHASTKSVIHDKYDKSTPYEYDLGLVLLKTAPKGITPAKVAIIVPKVGTAISLIGFGETSKGAKDNNVKRIATNKVAVVKALYFTIAGASGTNGNACYGDSGGPVLFKQVGQESVGGVLSYITGSCGTTTRVTRMDLYTAWLKKESGGDVQLLDLTPPTVTITAPADGATVGQSVQLQATATDKLGIASVQALVDGQSQDAKTTAPFDFTLTLAPGQRKLEVKASDAAGNSSSASVTVTVQAPEAGIVADSGATTEAGSAGDGSTTDPNDPRASDGCTVGAVGSRPALPLLFLALLALIWRRRSRATP
jgi:secreted trypsin-like serine protease